ncbi:MAG TPA: hypothetical protein VHN16_11510, partial [Streptosporangiaceae bacterium]|nr:hypothetical protein [Streptosporangiaceae bacterium]
LRLLRCYPPSHREFHREEMLGVLLATARPGRRRTRPSVSWPAALTRSSCPPAPSDHRPLSNCNAVRLPGAHGGTLAPAPAPAPVLVLRT